MHAATRSRAHARAACKRGGCGRVMRWRAGAHLKVSTVSTGSPNSSFLTQLQLWPVGDLRRVRTCAEGHNRRVESDRAGWSRARAQEHGWGHAACGGAWRRGLDAHVADDDLHAQLRHLAQVVQHLRTARWAQWAHMHINHLSAPTRARESRAMEWALESRAACQHQHESSAQAHETYTASARTPPTPRS